MLWWFVATVGGWLATGAFIPVLWKLSKLVSDEEPTGTEVTGAVFSVGWCERLRSLILPPQDRLMPALRGASVNGAPEPYDAQRETKPGTRLTSVQNHQGIRVVTP